MDIAKHPKLDRIMGTTVGVKSPPHAPATPHPAAKAAAPTQKETPPAHQPPGHIAHLAYNASSAPKKEPTHHAQTQAVKSDSLLLPLILGIGGVIFFVAYAIIWMRFFGL